MYSFHCIAFIRASPTRTNGETCKIYYTNTPKNNLAKINQNIKLPTLISMAALGKLLITDHEIVVRL